MYSNVGWQVLVCFQHLWHTVIPVEHYLPNKTENLMEQSVTTTGHSCLSETVLLLISTTSRQEANPTVTYLKSQDVWWIKDLTVYLKWEKLEKYSDSLEVQSGVAVTMKGFYCAALQSLWGRTVLTKLSSRLKSNLQTSVCGSWRLVIFMKVSLVLKLR